MMKAAAFSVCLWHCLLRTTCGFFDLTQILAIPATATSKQKTQQCRLQLQLGPVVQFLCAILGRCTFAHNSALSVILESSHQCISCTQHTAHCTLYFAHCGSPSIHTNRDKRSAQAGGKSIKGNTNISIIIIMMISSYHNGGGACE